MIVLIISVLTILASRIGSTHFLVVLSGSMSPTINMGDLVIVTPTDSQDIKVNDIIAFKDTDKKFPTTHRVIEITDQGFKTKGDANEDPDSRIVKPNEVIGKVAFKIPYAGYFVHYARSKLGFLFLILIPGIVIIIAEIRNILKYRKESKHEWKTYILPFLLILSSLTSVMTTKAYFSDTEISIGNTFTAWVAPAIPANISIDPIDDAFVRSITPGINYGKKKIIMVTNITNFKGNASIINEGFLKFDLSGLPDDAVITSAEVRMYGLGISLEKNIGILHSENLNSFNRLFSPAQVNILFVPDDTWDEDSITWDNKPSVGENLDTQKVGFPRWKTSYYAWDVTSKVKEEFENDKTISFALITEKGLAIFLSKESKKGKPYLFIEYTSTNPVVQDIEMENPDSSTDEFLIEEAKRILDDCNRQRDEMNETEDTSSSGSGNSDGSTSDPTESNSTFDCIENWICGNWSECVNGTQTRNCTDINNCNTTLNKPPVIRECNSTDNITQNCTENWNCTEWSECINGTQTRNCTDLNNCGTTLNKPPEIQECNATGNQTRCIEDWLCTEWSECINGTQYRNCTDLNDCNTTFNKPPEFRDCNSTQNFTCVDMCGDGICQEVVCLADGCPCQETRESCPVDCANSTENSTQCIENWNCTEWSECINGTQTRTCIDLNECNTTLNKPPELQECDVTTSTTTTTTSTSTTIPTNETS